MEMKKKVKVNHLQLAENITAFLCYLGIVVTGVVLAILKKEFIRKVPFELQEW